MAPTKSFLDAAACSPETCDTLATTTFREADGHPRGTSKRNSSVPVHQFKKWAWRSYLSSRGQVTSR